jgi:Mg2+/Co2+ transporter CorB
LAGLIIQKFGKIPNTNEKIRVDNYEITVLKKVKNTVSMVQLKKVEE